MASVNPDINVQSVLMSHKYSEQFNAIYRSLYDASDNLVRQHREAREIHRLIDVIYRMEESKITANEYDNVCDIHKRIIALSKPQPYFATVLSSFNTSVLGSMLNKTSNLEGQSGPKVVIEKEIEPVVVIKKVIEPVVIIESIPKASSEASSEASSAASSEASSAVSSKSTDNDSMRINITKIISMLNEQTKTFKMTPYFIQSKYDNVVKSYPINDNSSTADVIKYNIIEYIMKTYKNFVFDLCKPLYIATDGSCKNNGSANASATYGVYIPALDYIECNKVKSHLYSCVNSDIVCDIVSYMQPSNNRGELLGICYALRYVKEHALTMPIIILTDSEYSYKSLTLWYPKRLREGKLKDTKNLDLLEIAYKLLTPNITFQHINSHTPEPNYLADSLKYYLWWMNDYVDKLN